MHTELFKQIINDFHIFCGKEKKKRLWDFVMSQACKVEVQEENFNIFSI